MANFFFPQNRAKEIWRNHHTPHRAVDIVVSHTALFLLFLGLCMAF